MTKHNRAYRNGLPPLEPYDPYRASLHYKMLPEEIDRMTEWYRKHDSTSRPALIKEEHRIALMTGLEVFFCVIAIVALLYGVQTS